VQLAARPYRDFESKIFFNFNFNLIEKPKSPLHGFSVSPRKSHEDDKLNLHKRNWRRAAFRYF
jgi:hypothetical protein